MDNGDGKWRISEIVTTTCARLKRITFANMEDAGGTTNTATPPRPAFDPACSLPSSTVLDYDSDLPEEYVKTPPKKLNSLRFRSFKRLRSKASTPSTATTIDALSLSTVETTREASSMDSHSSHSGMHMPSFDSVVGMYGVFEHDGAECLLHLTDDQLRWVVIDKNTKKCEYSCVKINMTFRNHAVQDKKT